VDNEFIIIPKSADPTLHNAALLVGELGEIIQCMAENIAQDIHDEPTPFDVDVTAEALLRQLRLFLDARKPRAHQLTVKHAAAHFGVAYEEK
jgi:hypothetical protein